MAIGEPRTFLQRAVGRMIIVRETKEMPSDDEWDDFLAAVVAARDNAPNVRILVITDGGGPTVGQRKRLQAALDQVVFRVAVVTDSMKVRFIVSSIALVNKDISTFSKASLSEAYEYLELTPSERHTARAIVEELGRELGQGLHISP